MLKKLDKEFEQVLNDPQELDKRLAQLSGLRMAFSYCAMLFTLLFLAILTLETEILKRSGESYPGLVITLAIATISTIVAIIAHCEIRTLLTFKKLRDLRTKE